MPRSLLSLLSLLIPLAVTAGAADLADIRGRGSLKVLAVLDTSRPEFFATRANLPPGFDHEVLKGFAEMQKLKLQVVPIPTWDGLIPALLAGKGDVIAGRFTATELRRKTIDFTSEVFPYRTVVITRKPNNVVSTLEELRREKVGTMKGTNLAEVIATLDMPPANVDDAIPTGGLIEALRSGRVTAIVWGVESAIASQQEDPDLQIGMFVGAPLTLAYGVRKEDGELLAALNEYVENFRRSPAWNRLVVKYFGEAAPEILKKARASE